MESILKLSLFDRLKLNGRLVLLEKVGSHKFRKVIQKKGEYYEIWRLPINGDKSLAVNLNKGLSEQDIKDYLS